MGVLTVVPLYLTQLPHKNHTYRQVSADLSFSTAASGFRGAVLDLACWTQTIHIFLYVFEIWGEYLKVGFQILYCYFYMQKIGMKTEHALS